MGLPCLSIFFTFSSNSSPLFLFHFSFYIPSLDNDIFLTVDLLMLEMGLFYTGRSCYFPHFYTRIFVDVFLCNRACCFPNFSNFIMLLFENYILSAGRYLRKRLARKDRPLVVRLLLVCVNFDCLR